MPEFLRLELDEQGDILAAISARTGRTAQVLLKDVWVCWALRELFARDTSVRMAFKGGTSLSKVFALIHRFSEDIDVTLDCRDLAPGTPLCVADMSKSQMKRLSDRIKESVEAHVRNVILPELSTSFQEVTNGDGRVESSEDGEKIWLHFPTPLWQTSDYIQDTVLLEFGGRNVTEPSGPHQIAPFLADEGLGLDFPVADVIVLAPERTFWEKATLIHVECNRQRSLRPERLSRHWYDLVMLGQTQIGVDAMSNRMLLEEVVAHKRVFFDASYAHYEACLTGGLRLVPDDSHLSELEQDYKQMQEAGMFDVEPPAFTEIIDLLKTYESRINDV